MGKPRTTKAVKKEEPKVEDAMEEEDLQLVKYTQPRGQPFDLELGAGFSIRLQMYSKNTEAKPDIKFTPISAPNLSPSKVETTELRKVRRYETMADDVEMKVAFEDIDKAGDEQFQDEKKMTGGANLPGGREIAKENVIKGYRYGESLIPVSKEEAAELDLPRKGKQLQLIQFTKKTNILPQFLLTSCRYLVPYTNDLEAHNAFSALVEGMLASGTVALVRYAYNVNSNPRVVCLIPKKTKEHSYPVLMHYQLPFNEDIRSYEFPALDEISERPTDYQHDLIDCYIDNMDLGGHDDVEELVRCREVKNPKFLHMSTILLHKAKHPHGGSLPEVDKQQLLAELNPPQELLAKARTTLADIAEAFPLERNLYTRVAAFKAKDAAEDVKATNGQATGVGKVEASGIKNEHSEGDQSLKIEKFSE